MCVCVHTAPIMPAFCVEDLKEDMYFLSVMTLLGVELGSMASLVASPLFPLSQLNSLVFLFPFHVYVFCSYICLHITCTQCL